MRVERLLGRVNGFCGWERSKKSQNPHASKTEACGTPSHFSDLRARHPPFSLVFGWHLSPARGHNLFVPHPHPVSVMVVYGHW